MRAVELTCANFMQMIRASRIAAFPFNRAMRRRQSDVAILYLPFKSIDSARLRESDGLSFMFDLCG